jgi:hypothetical protein
MSEKDKSLKPHKKIRHQLTASLGKISFSRGHKTAEAEQEYEPNLRYTKSFFEQDPRSTVLRNICLEAINQGRAVIASDGEDTEAIDGLFTLNSQLHEMGIEPEMHVIDRDDPDAEKKKAAMAQDPVSAMEWAAGQVRVALIEVGTGSLSEAELSEHTEQAADVSSHAVSTYTPNTVSRNTKDFLVSLKMVGALKSFIDYDAGPTEIQ